jgi:hypothetical protein
MPIYAKPTTDYESVNTGLHRRMPIVLPPGGQPASVATFAFAASGDRYVVPRGFASSWVTIAAPAKP